MRHAISDVVVLGGGAAAWMTAAYLGRALHGRVRITVVETGAGDRIGGGDPLPAHLQAAFFEVVGLREDEWIRACDATLTAGVKLVNWSAAPPGRNEYFYHPAARLPSCDGVPLSHYWVLRRQHGDTTPFDYACFPEAAVMDARLSPRRLDGQRAIAYAWHCDGRLLAEELRHVAVERQRVQHVTGTLAAVLFDARGHIVALAMTDGRTVRGDFFVDCSGPAALLVGRALGEPFIELRHEFLCDAAVVASVPHDAARYGIEPYSSGIAMRSGWAWKLPLVGRFETAYVFSSVFASASDAARDLCRLWGVDERTASLRALALRSGRRMRPWVKNCVGIGRASCFLEPLEPTEMLLTWGAIVELARHFPDAHFDPALVDRFNHAVAAMFDDSRDFIQAHYAVCPRRDSPFWRANRHEVSISASLAEKLTAYEAGLPVAAPGGADEGAPEKPGYREWTNDSYYSIFAGVGVTPERPLPLLLYRLESRRRAQRAFAEVARRRATLVETLPTLYAFLRRLRQPQARSVDWSGPATGAATARAPWPDDAHAPV